MAFDGIAVSAVVAELNDKLANTRVAKIYQPNRHTIIIHLRDIGQNHKLLISADPSSPRIHTTSAPDPNPQTPPAFCMLLRKHLEPSRVLDVRQVEFERIIVIRFEAYDLDAGMGEKSLVFELMGRNSNLILIDQDQTIIDAIYRNTDSNHERPVMPGITYQLPPVHNKLNPKRSNLHEFSTALRMLPEYPAAKALVKCYQGLGPQAASEICARSRIDLECKNRDLSPGQVSALWQSMMDLISAEPWPTLITEPKPDFFAYEPVHSRESGNVQRFAALDELLDSFFTAQARDQRLSRKISQLLGAVNAHLQRLRRKEQIHRQTLDSAAQADDWQKKGEIILANLYRIKKGDTVLEAVDYYEPGQPSIAIELDPKLSPSENAQLYFKKYVKAKRSAHAAAQQLKETLALIDYLEEISLQLLLADDPETAAEIETELIKEGMIEETSSTKRKTARSDMGRRSKQYDQYLASDGTLLLLGRSNRQNDFVTFKAAKPEYLWLHAQKVPGSHVIVCTDKEVSPQTLLEAATLAAYYSRNRENTKAAVDYTRRKHVRKPPQAKPGFVVYDHFQTIIVDPTKAENLPRRLTAPRDQS